VISHPAVTCTIPATATAEHIRENVLASEDRLPTPKERQRLVEFVES